MPINRLTQMTEPNNGGIYAILDTLSGQLAGGLQLHRHDAVAIRTFDDIASQPNSLILRHPADYQLVKLGTLTLDNEIEPQRGGISVIFTGAQWNAMREQREANT